MTEVIDGSADRVRYRAVDGLLPELAAAGEVQPELAALLRRVPREVFVPDQAWIGADQVYETLDRLVTPERWCAAAYTDRPIIIAFDTRREKPTCVTPAPSHLVAYRVLLCRADGEYGHLGGVIVAPLCSDLASGPVVAFTVRGAGTATGRIQPVAVEVARLRGRGASTLRSRVRIARDDPRVSVIMTDTDAAELLTDQTSRWAVAVTCPTACAKSSTPPSPAAWCGCGTRCPDLGQASRTHGGCSTSSHPAGLDLDGDPRGAVDHPRWGGPSPPQRSEAPQHG